MYDLKRSFFSSQLEKIVATGQTVPVEGAILVTVLENGEDRVQLSGANAGEKPVGFSNADNENILSLPGIEAGTVPATGAPEINASQTTLTAAVDTRVFDVTNAVDLTLNAGGPPGAGEFTPTIPGGLFTFNAAEAGNDVIIYYRFNITVADQIQRFYQRSVNNGASEFFNQIAVGGGQGEIYTMEYDTAQDFANVAAGTLRTGPNGRFTVGGTGTSFGRVIKAPTPDDLFLGIAYTVPNLD